MFSMPELRLFEAAYELIRAKLDHLKLFKKEKFSHGGWGIENWFQIELLFAWETAGFNVAIKGKMAEQLAPIFDAFGYEPSDARFIEDPVDYVIFDGYTKVRKRKEDRLITVIMADVKTGEAGLAYEQERAKAGVEQVRVRFETIRI